MKEDIFRVLFAAAWTGLTLYFGKIAIPVIVLLVVMAVDYITGMIKARITNQINSRVGVVGILKKIGYLLAACVGFVVDWIICSALTKIDVAYPVSFPFGILVIIWFIINELISILENLGSIGVPLPNFLIKIVGKLKVTVDKKADGEED